MLMFLRESAVNNILTAAYNVVKDRTSSVSEMSDEEINTTLKPALDITERSVTVAITRVRYSNSILNYFYGKRHGEKLSFCRFLPRYCVYSDLPSSSPASIKAGPSSSSLNREPGIFADFSNPSITDSKVKNFAQHINNIYNSSKKYDGNKVYY